MITEMQVYLSDSLRKAGFLLFVGLPLLAAACGGAAPHDVTSTSYSALPARCIEERNAGAYSIKDAAYQFVTCANPENGLSLFEKKVGDNGWKETIFRR